MKEVILVKTANGVDIDNCFYCGHRASELTQIRVAIKPPNTPNRWKVIGVACNTCNDKFLSQIEPSRVGAEVKVKLADILQILDDEHYTVSVHSNDTIDDKISESIANTAIIDFKKQLKQELLSKFSA